MAERAPEQESELLRVFKQGMTQGNRAWNEGDFERAYGVLPEDFEYELADTWPQARPLRGPDEIVAFFQDFREAFPDVRSGDLEFIQADERTVIVGFPVGGTGAASGARTEMEIWQVWEFEETDWRFSGAVRGFRPVRVKEFSDRRAALEAAEVDQDPGENG